MFDVEEQSHKGLGRLVYLCYFDKVEVKSVFDNSKQRVFEFNEAFDKDCTITEIEPTLNGSIFRMRGFTGERLGKNDYINPHYIKKALLENFYMKFYKAKLAGKQISVYIKTTIGGSSVEDTINTDELPKVSLYDITLKRVAHE